MRTTLIAVLALSLFILADAQDNSKSLPKDIPSLKALAEKGDARAQYNLGLKHYNGDGVKKDFREAVKWFRKAAKQGNVDGQVSLGGMYLNGLGVERDTMEAAKWYRKALEEKNPLSQAQKEKLAETKVVALPKDIPSLKALAEKGDARTQYNLGLKHYNGDGVKKDFREAMKWFRKAAEQGHAAGQRNLGAMYANGEGVEKNFKKAIQWHRKAAEQGNADGQISLGRMYNQGQGVKNDFKEAAKWYRKAAEQGVASAQFFLGGMYKEGKGVEKNANLAVDWYRRAADQEYAPGQVSLGLMYYDGIGVEKNFKEAAKWYRKAAEQEAIDEMDVGPSWGQLHLAEMYFKGEGVNKDEVSAAKWFRKIAGPSPHYPRGVPAAQTNLGVIYVNGEGPLEDLVRAYAWFIIAASNGSEIAMINKGNMAKVMTPDKIAKAQELSKKLLFEKVEVHEGKPAVAANNVELREAAQLGDTRAQYILGNQYYFAKGVEKDVKKAAMWWRKAAMKDHSDAQNNLGVIYLNGEIGKIPSRPGTGESLIYGATKPDKVEGYFWKLLSSFSDPTDKVQGNKLYQLEGGSMNHRDLLEGQGRARAWVPQREVKGLATHPRVIAIRSQQQFERFDAAGGGRPRSIKSVLREFGQPDLITKNIQENPTSYIWTRHTFFHPQQVGLNRLRAFYKKLIIPIDRGTPTGEAFLKVR